MIRILEMLCQGSFEFGNALLLLLDGPRELDNQGLCGGGKLVPQCCLESKCCWKKERPIRFSNAIVTRASARKGGAGGGERPAGVAGIMGRDAPGAARPRAAAVALSHRCWPPGPLGGAG